MDLLKKKYTNPAYLSRLLILFVDVFLVCTAICLAFLLRFDYNYDKLFPDLKFFLPKILLIRLICFRIFRTYSVIVRYAGLQDLFKIFLSVSAGSAFMIAIVLLFRLNYDLTKWSWGFYPYYPLSIFIIEYILSLALIGGFRIAMPFIFNLVYNKSKDKSKTIIFGAGQLGSLTLDLLSRDTNNKYNIVGIVDDNPDLKNKYLNGIPVYHIDSLSELFEVHDVENAIMAIKNIRLKRKNEFVEYCLKKDINVMQVPVRSDWDQAEFTVNEIKKIKIEDLLNREAINLGKEQIKNYIQGKVVLVTGGAGSIGSEIVRQLIGFNPGKIYILDQAESPLVNLGLEIKEKYGYERVEVILANVSDRHRLQFLFKKMNPQIVFHAAAYKHVPIIESFPSEAIKVNVLGTKNVVELSSLMGVEKFVLVSTDKAVNPTNAMGASKRIAELFVQCVNNRSKTQCIITRFGNVLGSNGSVIPRFKKQIETGGPVTVTHPEIIRYFMTIPEASQLVIEAGVMGEGGEILLFDMGEPVKILDLAEKLIRLAGYKPHDDIEIQFTGLRPGEKLYEELLTTNENSVPTHHPKILKGKFFKIDFDKTEEQINKLIESIDKITKEQILKDIQAIVPEYKKPELKEIEDTPVKYLNVIK